MVLTAGGGVSSSPFDAPRTRASPRFVRWLIFAAFGSIIPRTNLTHESQEHAPLAMEKAPRMDSKIRHLELIQGVINRLASDSFRMKGWCVVLVAALFILLAREGRIEFLAVAWVPVVFFWGLDGYFLWQERLFRALYDHD